MVLAGLVQPTYAESIKHPLWKCSLIETDLNEKAEPTENFSIKELSIIAVVPQILLDLGGSNIEMY